jgi:hypothetical protein
VQPIIAINDGNIKREVRLYYISLAYYLKTLPDSKNSSLTSLVFYSWVGLGRAGALADRERTCLKVFNNNDIILLISSKLSLIQVLIL